jgi:hypothetical protein
MPKVLEIDVKKVSTETVVKWCLENYQVDSNPGFLPPAQHLADKTE